MSKSEKLEEIEGHLTLRKVAHIVLEAATPLKVGSGDSDITIDSPVLVNWNGLPMIQGSSLAGVLRASFDDDLKKYLFGEKFGSRVLVCHLHLVDENGDIPYGLGLPSNRDKGFLDRYYDLPVREHTAIEHTGGVKDGHKFDNEVVYTGSRFKFELEFISNDSSTDQTYWRELLEKLTSPLFRLGGGSTKGFGEMKVVSCYEQSYTLGIDYHLKPSDLNKLIGTKTLYTSTDTPTVYSMRLKPDDFFSFGAGYGDDEVDDIAITEEVVEWEDPQGNPKKGEFSKRKILFPASSLKGALSHRLAFHYNKIKRYFADEIPLGDIEKHIGTNNLAVHTLFGAEKGHDKEQKGKALFSDMYQTDLKQTKIFDHVKIDRFTGGAIDSALYNENVIAQEDIWEIKITLVEDGLNDLVIKAFEATLDDLVKGWLPLGGKVNRGHGVFISPDYEPNNPQKRGWDCTKGGEKCS